MIIDQKLPRAFCVLQQDIPEVPIAELAKKMEERFGMRSEILCDGQVWFHIPTGMAVRDGREPDNIKDSAEGKLRYEFLNDLRRPDWRNRANDYTDKEFWESYWLSAIGIVFPSLSYHLSIFYRGVHGFFKIADKSHWIMIAGWNGESNLQLRFQFRKSSLKAGSENVLKLLDEWERRVNLSTWPDGTVTLDRIGVENLVDGFVYRVSQICEMKGGNVFPWLDLYFSIRLKLPPKQWPTRVYWGKDSGIILGPPPFVILQ